MFALGSAHALHHTPSLRARSGSPTRTSTYAPRTAPHARRSNQTLSRLENPERFVEEVRGDDTELAAHLQFEERELEAGGTSKSGTGRTVPV